MSLINILKSTMLNKVTPGVFMPQSCSLKYASIHSCPSLSSIINGLINNADVSSDIKLFRNLFVDKRIRNSSELNLNEIKKQWDAQISKDSLIISSARVDAGFNNGFIDYINGAILKTNDGWIDNKKTIVLKHDASKDDVKSYISRKINIVDSLSDKDLYLFNDKGQIVINNKVVAIRTNENPSAWMLNNKTVMIGDIERLGIVNGIKRIISHSNVIAYFCEPNNNVLFHGTTSKSSDNTSLNGAPLLTSRLGPALYTTKSLREAISIYANPYSFESSSKRYALNQEQEEQKKYIHSQIHVISANNDCNLFCADINREYITADDLPSPYALELLAVKYSEINGGVLNKAISRIYSSQTSYDIYQVLNDLNDAFIDKMAKKHFDRSPFQDVFMALGFDGVEINFPDVSFTDKLNSIVSCDGNENKELFELFKKNNISQDTVISLFDKYKTELFESIPKNGLVGHTLFFGTKEQKFSEIKSISLPLCNKETHNSIGDLYCYSNKEIPLSFLEQLSTTNKLKPVVSDQTTDFSL